MNGHADAAAESAIPNGMVRRKRKRRSRHGRVETRLIHGIASITAGLAIVSNASPTGLAPFDAVLTALFAAAVTLASSRAKRWTLVWMAGIATAGAIGSWWVIPGALAFMPLAILISGHHRNSLMGAIVGGLAVQSVLNAPPAGFEGAQSLIAAVAIAPVLWSAFSRLSAREARRVRTSALFIAGATLIAVAGLSMAAISARAKVDNAVSSSESAMNALRAGDQETAGRLFTQAADEFERAETTLRSPWAMPSRLVPIVGHNAKALQVAASSGHSLALSAADAATSAPYQQLRSSAGTVDIARIEAMQEPVDASLETLRATQRRLEQLRSPWLIPQVDSGLGRFRHVVDDAVPQADLASATLQVLPELLGAGTPKRYFLAFGNLSETRFQGGFLGAFGELTAQDGKLTLTRSGPIRELNDQPGAEERNLDAMRVYHDRYGRYRPEYFLQNLTASPDFPSNAAAIANLYPQAGGEPIDGVIYVDPFGLAALLALTGPVEVDGLDVKLDSENAAKFLLADQYLDGKTTNERQDALVDASHATFSALTSRDLPTPSKMTKALSPAVRGGHIAFTTFDSKTNDYLVRIGLTGSFIETFATDYLDVRVANAGGNKIDAFLSRTVDYKVTFDPRTGSVEATATVELTNSAPSTGVPDYVIGNSYGLPPGTNRLWLAVFTPLALESAKLDDSVTATESQEELGANVYSTLVAIPPGESMTVELKLSGSWPNMSTYRLNLGHQPLVNDDTASVEVRPADDVPAVSGAEGMEIDGSGARWSDVVTGPMRFEVQFRSPES